MTVICGGLAASEHLCLKEINDLFLSKKIRNPKLGEIKGHSRNQ